MDTSRLLIEHGVDVNAHTRNGSTERCTVRQGRHLNNEKLLIDIAANIDSRNNKPEAGNTSGLPGIAKAGHLVTPLHIVGVSTFKVTKFLLGRGINIDIRNGRGDDIVPGI